MNCELWNKEYERNRTRAVREGGKEMKGCGRVEDSSVCCLLLYLLSLSSIVLNA